jgi:hypothetical protein
MVLPLTLPLSVLMAFAVDVFVVVFVVVVKCRLLSFCVTVDVEWSYVVLVLVLGPAYALIEKASDRAPASKVFFIRCSSLDWSVTYRRVRRYPSIRRNGARPRSRGLSH